MQQTITRIRWHQPSLDEEGMDAAVVDALPLVVPNPIREVVLRVGIPIVEGAETAREYAIGLLKLAAEVEHALMVQYLYAAVSVSAEPAPDGINYQRKLLSVAIQEMGHLATVQNLLLLVGGRDGFYMQRDLVRTASEKNPIPLVLEPISKTSLAKYVAAEKPAQVPPELAAKVAELVQLAQQDAGVEPHRVGVIYELLRWVFTPPGTPSTGIDFATLAPLPKQPHLSDADFAATLPLVPRYEAIGDEEWQVFDEEVMILKTAHTCYEARDAINHIAQQGEGLTDGSHSHFLAFMEMVTAFEGGKITVKPIAKAPTLDPDSSVGNVISHPYTKLWGEVFSLQYNLLVLTIYHALLTERPADGSLALRRALAELAVFGMRRVIHPLSDLVASLPLHADGTGGKAGPPFDLDPSVLQSNKQSDLVSQHLRLLDRLASLYNAIQSAPDFSSFPDHANVLTNLRNVDKRRRDLFPPSAQPLNEQLIAKENQSMRYRIFPAIGIARLGQDNNFFLGPELQRAKPGDLQADGTVTPITQYKDATRTRIRKQGARFHLFESSDGTNWTPANLPAGATVTWTVTLVNKKSAVTRPPNPPTVATRPVVPPANQPLVINGGTKQVSGPNATSTPFVGPYATTAPDGTPFQVNVELGSLRTDGQGRLIVLGGNGQSAAPNNVPIGGSYYRNPKWHDDVSDGPVTAEIRLTPASAPVQAEEGAWVVVTPPDYAPGIDCVVTLYDIMRQLAISELGLPAPGPPSFDLDIAPIINRVRRLRFVHADATWSDTRFSSPQLRSTAAADQPLRSGVVELILKAETVFQGHTSASGPPFRLRSYQKKSLNDWALGNFDSTPTPMPTSLSAEGLTRASLEGAAGQGFCPGIEAGIIVLDKTLYSAPFDYRFNHSSLEAGDITALMAQPWQADFLKCNTEWWPTQRPDLAPQADGSLEDWVRGAAGHKLLVERHQRLGLVVQQGATEVFLEVERDPTL